MLFKADKSKHTTSTEHRWTEVIYDALPDSWVPSVPAHWHKNHDEYVQVLTGRMELIVNGKSTIVKAGDPPIFIERLHVHASNFFKGEATTVKESTNPAGDFKAVFFENLLDDGTLNMVSMLRACYDGDTYLSLPGGLQWMDAAFVSVAGGFARWMWPQQHKNLSAENLKQSGG